MGSKKVTTKEDALKKARADLAVHHERQAKLTKATQKPARKVPPAAQAHTSEEHAKCTEAKARKMSGLDAAAQVLADHSDSGAMTPKEITEVALAEGRWKPAGKTPAATLASALIRDIRKGPASRFEKVSPGHFALRIREAQA